MKIDPSKPVGHSMEPKEPTRDTMLQLFVEFANGHGLVFGITLIAGGVVISGDLVPHEKYFSDFTSQFDLAEKPNPIAEALAEFFRKMQPEVSAASAVEAAAPETMKRKPQYLHMADARILLGNGGFQSIGPLRVRLSSVTGWSLGKWSIETHTAD